MAFWYVGAVLIVHFPHLTYQEYFTAEYLVNTENYAKVYNYLTDRRWSFVIELISELIPREQSWQFFVDFKKYNR